MKIVYDESYGDLSYMQRAAYRKYNVSPLDHDELVYMYGERNFKEIEKVVRDPQFHIGKTFSIYKWSAWYRENRMIR